jgi:outer membrane protein assembly factor BamB
MFAGNFRFLSRLSLVVLAISLSVSAQQTAMFRGGAAHLGQYAGPAAGIDHVRWAFRTGGRVFSSPTVADGVVYVGSDDHFLYALDATTGGEKWKFKTGGNVRSTPAVWHGRVYFLSLDGNLYAVSAATGKLDWKFATEGESRLTVKGLYGMEPSQQPMPDPWDLLLSSPTVADGRVYFGSGDHHVYAVDARTGRLDWKFAAGDVVHSSPAVANGTVYIGCWNGVLYALDAATGRLRWKFASGVDKTHFMQGIPGSPAVADGVVAFGSRDNYIYGLNSRTGRELWRQANHGAWVIASPAIRNGVVYITTSDSMQFRALNLKTGTPLWSLPYRAYSFSSPALAGGHAYFGTFEGRVYDVDLAQRKYAGSFQVQAAREHPGLLLANGHLNTKAIYGPLGPDGQPNNTLQAAIVGVNRLLKLGAVVASPSVVDGVVYAASTDGYVYALN